MEYDTMIVPKRSKNKRWKEVFMEKLHVKTVAVDIDQTIATGAIHAFIQHYNRDLQLGLTPERIAEASHYAQSIQVPEILAYRQAHEAEFEESRKRSKTSPLVSLSMQELPGAVAGVKSLHEVGLIRYYTVRAREVEKATREWLTNKGFPNPQEVVLCEGLHDKLFKVIRTEKLNDREAQSVVLLIDDRCERLVRAAEEIVATRPRLRDAFRHLVLVAFGVADEATQFEPTVLSETGLKMMSLPSWEHIDAFKQHFHRGEERMLNEISRVNAFRS